MAKIVFFTGTKSKNVSQKRLETCCRVTPALSWFYTSVYCHVPVKMSQCICRSFVKSPLCASIFVIIQVMSSEQTTTDAYGEFFFFSEPFFLIFESYSSYAFYCSSPLNVKQWFSDFIYHAADNLHALDPIISNNNYQ